MFDKEGNGGQKTYALLALAIKNVFSIWKFSNRNCPTMTAGENIPTKVRAPPKRPPDSADCSAETLMLEKSVYFWLEFNSFFLVKRMLLLLQQVDKYNCTIVAVG